MATRPFIQKPTNLQGERGLIAAVIVTAANDLLSSDQRQAESARRYFTGGVIGGPYAWHLEALDLPVEWLPAVFETEQREVQI